MAKESLTLDLDTELVDRVRRYSEERGAEIAEVLSELISALPEAGGSNGSTPDQNGSNGRPAGSTSDWRATLTPRVRRLLGAASTEAAPAEGHDQEWVQSLPPITQRLLGVAPPGAGEDDYKEYLWQKYGR